MAPFLGKFLPPQPAVSGLRGIITNASTASEASTTRRPHVYAAFERARTPGSALACAVAFACVDLVREVVGRGVVPWVWASPEACVRVELHGHDRMVRLGRGGAQFRCGGFKLDLGALAVGANPACNGDECLRCADVARNGDECLRCADVARSGGEGSSCADVARNGVKVPLCAGAAGFRAGCAATDGSALSGSLGSSSSGCGRSSVSST